MNIEKIIFMSQSIANVDKNLPNDLYIANRKKNKPPSERATIYFKFSVSSDVILIV
jgi:hypothetical protein